MKKLYTTVDLPMETAETDYEALVITDCVTDVMNRKNRVCVGYTFTRAQTRAVRERLTKMGVNFKETLDEYGGAEFKRL